MDKEINNQKKNIVIWDYLKVPGLVFLIVILINILIRALKAYF